MKKTLLFISGILLAACVLTGCLDSEEDVTINANGSGTYRTTIDMSGLFDMMQMAAMMDTSAGKELKQFSDKNIDSSFSLGSFTDTAQNLTADEKALLHDGSMRMTVNQKNKVFKIALNYPFKKVEDVQKLMDLQQSGKTVDPMANKTKGNAAMAALGDKGLPSVGQFTNTIFRDGLIERKVDKQKLNELKNDESFGQMQSAGEMLSGITFTTSIHLPKAAKTSSGSKVSLSDDKKTVRIKYTLLDMIKTPEALEFKVEY